MLMQVKNKVLLIEAISYAEILFGDETATLSKTVLSLIIDGHKLELYGDEAVAVWLAVQQDSVCLLRPERSESMTASLTKEG